MYDRINQRILQEVSLITEIILAKYQGKALQFELLGITDLKLNACVKEYKLA